MVSKTFKNRTLTFEPTRTKNLNTLMREEGGIRLTLYMPIEHAAPQSDQNPVRLKDLLSDAEVALKENGLSAENVREFLKPLSDILKTPDVFLREGKSIVFFVDEFSATGLDIPYEVATSCLASNRFSFKPLIPLISENAEYALLTIAGDSVALYRGDCLGIVRESVEDMPESIDDVAWVDDPEKSLQHHTASTTPSPGQKGGTPTEIFHGHGGPDDLKRNQRKRFFKAVGQAVDRYLKNHNLPLILMAVERNLGLFKEVNPLNHHTAHEIDRDPHNLKEKQLREIAVPVVEEHLQKHKDRVIESLEAANGQKNEAYFTLEKAAPAAGVGQIATAVVASDKVHYGECEPERMEVHLFNSGNPNCVMDLLDYVATKTLLHGGEAYTVPADLVPGSGDVAAIRRY